MRYVTTRKWAIPPNAENLFNEAKSLIIIGSKGSPLKKIAIDIAEELSKKHAVFYFSFRGKESPFKTSGIKGRERKISTKYLDFFNLKHSPEDVHPIYDFSSRIPRNSVIFIDDFDDLVLSFRMWEDNLSPEELLYLIQKDIVEDSHISVLIPTSYDREEIYRIADMVMKIDDKKINNHTVKILRVIFSSIDEYLISQSGDGYLFHSPGGIQESKAKKVDIKKDGKGYISTGIEDLDNMLDGGFKPGSYNVFEISKDVLNEAYRPIIYLMAINNIKKGRGVLIAPAESSSSEDYFSEIHAHVDEEKIKYLKILRSTPIEEKKPWFVDGYSQSVDGRFEVWKMVMEHMMKMSNGSVIDITEYGAIESTFSKNDVVRLVSQGVKWMSEWGSVGIGVISEESEVKNKLMYLSHRYLKIRNIGSIYCIESIKPSINPRIIDIEEKGKKIKIKLRRII